MTPYDISSLLYMFKKTESSFQGSSQKMEAVFYQKTNNWFLKIVWTGRLVRVKLPMRWASVSDTLNVWS